MHEMNSFGKVLIIFGAIAIAAGVVIVLSVKLPWFGRLPGDIFVEKKDLSFYFPITTSIILSILASLVMIFLRKR